MLAQLIPVSEGDEAPILVHQSAVDAALVHATVITRQLRQDNKMNELTKHLERAAAKYMQGKSGSDPSMIITDLCDQWLIRSSWS